MKLKVKGGGEGSGYSGKKGKDCKVSGFSAAAGPKNGRSIRKKTLKKRITNIEQGIMNVEVRYSIDLY
jgi:hypothetical protein